MLYVSKKKITLFLRNSILQCIFATPSLNDYFTDPQYKRSVQKPLSTSYADLVKLISSSQNSAVLNPSDLKQAIQRKAPQFSGYQQQDAQEFLRYFLDGMSEELNRVSVKPTYKELNFDGMPLDKQSEMHWSYSLKRDDSIIVDSFSGQLLSALKCPACS